MADETTQAQEQTFTQADIDSLKAQHQEEMNNLAGKLRAEFKEKERQAKADAEKAARQANMSEVEKKDAELEELRGKYQESQDIIALTNQKDETRKLMSEIGVDDKCLDYVFVPKDMEATKARAKAFKAYIDEVKKTTFENNVQSKVPSAGGGATGSNVDINSAIRAAAGIN